MKKLVVVVFGLVSLFSLSRCSEKADAQEPAGEQKPIKVSCKSVNSEVKWFWGDVCPIDKNGFVSVGHSQSQGHITTGCVTQSVACEISQ